MFIIYGYYEGTRRNGGHAAAAIHYRDQYFIIYNGIGTEDDSLWDLNSYYSTVNGRNGIYIEAGIPFH